MILRTAVVACVLLASAPAHAETYKCTDKRGAITYSNEKCEKQGLQDAGPVRERLTTMPETSPTGRPATAKPAPKAEDDDERRPPRGNLTPINPLMEKLAK